MAKKKNVRPRHSSSSPLLLVLGGAIIGTLIVWLYSRLAAEPVQVAEVGTGIPAPTSLIVTCAEDNTSAELSWEDVSPGVYSLAVNDPDNDTDDAWYIDDSQDVFLNGTLQESTYTATITKDHEYEWWVISHSNEDPALTSIKAEGLIQCPQVEPSVEPSIEPSAEPSVSPSPSPSVSPTPSPSSLPATPLTTLRVDRSTCSSITLSWDRLTNVPGYVIELSRDASFNNPRSSGVLHSDQSNYTFESLDVNTSYYVRVSAANIHDFPRYTTISGARTSVSCVTSPSSTPSPTRPPATPRPSSSPRTTRHPSPSPRSSVRPSESALPATSIAPNVDRADGRFDNIPVDPGVGETPKQSSFFARFIAWLASLFD